MTIRPCTREDWDELARLRSALWPEESEKDHRRAIGETYGRDGDEAVAFLSCLESGQAVGFAEATLRRDYVNGCRTSPVVFLEGIYVCPRYRRQGIAKRLCEAVEVWARSCGSTELASDALLDNAASHAFHAAVGFEETEKVVFFRRELSGVSLQEPTSS